MRPSFFLTVSCNCILTHILDIALLECQFEEKGQKGTLGEWFINFLRLVLVDDAGF